MKLTVRRDSGWADKLRAYKIKVDGETVGIIKQGQVLEFEIPDGSRRLMLAVDWCRSNEVLIDGSQADVYFECGSSLRGARVFLAIIYATILWRQYLWLRPVEQ